MYCTISALHTLSVAISNHIRTHCWHYRLQTTCNTNTHWSVLFSGLGEKLPQRNWQPYHTLRKWVCNLHLTVKPLISILVSTWLYICITLQSTMCTGQYIVNGTKKFKRSSHKDLHIKTTNPLLLYCQVSLLSNFNGFQYFCFGICCHLYSTATSSYFCCTFVYFPTMWY